MLKTEFSSDLVGIVLLWKNGHILPIEFCIFLYKNKNPHSLYSL